jgi:glycosyltransferase involved in cell wall biosynthesis
MKVAIVHYWLVGMRGGEAVLESLCRMYPGADIFTHVYCPDRISETIRRHKIRTTLIARLPFARARYKNYLALMPYALEQLDLQDYDLVISSESGPAKGVLTRPDALHVCYCHTPMRYAWSGYHAYRTRSGPLTRMVMSSVMHRMRMWDLASAARVDHFIANSHNVADRIRKFYRREAVVVHPPVHLPAAAPAAEKGDFYLFVSQLVAYKNAELALAAFNRMGARLVVIGHGEEEARLRRMAGPTITMLGWADKATLLDHYRHCRALIFAADEDFGIVPLEAMAAGRPVIAFGRGGALETVLPDETGVFFDRPDAESLIAAVRRFEAREASFDPARIRAHAARFSEEVFMAQFRAHMERWLDEQRHRCRRHALPPPARLVPGTAAAA